MAKFRINEWLKKWLQITLNKFLTLRRNEIKFIIFFFWCNIVWIYILFEIKFNFYFHDSIKLWFEFLSRKLAYYSLKFLSNKVPEFTMLKKNDFHLKKKYRSSIFYLYTKYIFKIFIFYRRSLKFSKHFNFNVSNCRWTCAITRGSCLL